MLRVAADAVDTPVAVMTCRNGSAMSSASFWPGGTVAMDTLVHLLVRPHRAVRVVHGPPLDSICARPIASVDCRRINRRGTVASSATPVSLVLNDNELCLVQASTAQQAHPSRPQQGGRADPLSTRVVLRPPPLTSGPRTPLMVRPERRPLRLGSVAARVARDGRQSVPTGVTE